MEEISEKSVYNVLSKIDCSKFVEKKSNLSYLSWSHAWNLVKSKFSDAHYEKRYWEGKPYLYDDDLGYLVETTVTIQGETLSMHLPVMDSANKAQKKSAYTYKTKFGEKTVEAATMFDVNTAIMRCLVKNLAMFGLGINIYAGEDLPLSSDIDSQNEKKESKSKTPPQAPPPPKKVAWAQVDYNEFKDKVVNMPIIPNKKIVGEWILKLSDTLEGKSGIYCSVTLEIVKQYCTTHLKELQESGIVIPNEILGREENEKPVTTVTPPQA